VELLKLLLHSPPTGTFSLYLIFPLAPPLVLHTGLFLLIIFLFLPHFISGVKYLSKKIL
jgi:hypothetical protein